ncbi:MAG: 6-phosphogluconolactonase [Opitutaceae bacterium]
MNSDYGRVIVGSKAELFQQAADLGLSARATTTRSRFLWALTGGGTPKEWYQWMVSEKKITPAAAATIEWTVSDERHVLLSNPESNFGNAERQLFGPLDVPTDRRHPWMVAWPVAEAAEAYRRTMLILAGPGQAYDVCFLGMGDDCHTASLFPGTPLLRDDGGLSFDGQEVPGKGWRLTITPTGLRQCGLIVVMTLGAGKADALHRVMRGTYDPLNVPSQILKTCADRVVWLVDEAAAAKL